MSKLKNFIRNNLLGAIIGGLVFGASGVIADTIVNSGDVSYKETDVKSAVDDLYHLQKNRIWETVYPVGSIYTSVNSTSPEELFGGTWESFGQGRTLVGMGSNGTTNYDTVEKTGGSETKTIAVGNLPSHSHTYTPSGTIGNTGGGGKHNHSVSNTYSDRTSGNNNRGHTHTTNIGSHGHAMFTNTGSTTFGGTYAAVQGHWPDMRYYITGTSTAPGVYQTASTNIGNKTSGGESQNHTHSYRDYYANTTSGDHALTVAQMPSHNHTFTGTASSTTACTDCSGTALNTQDPYITVYMWKRTA